MLNVKCFGTALVSILLVASCSGGGGGGGSLPAPVPVTSAEGLYLGTTSNNRTMTGLVLDDGTFYVFYSQVGNPSVISGAVQGNGVSNNGSFSSTNVRDFSLEGLGVLTATVSASYASRQTLNGVITYSSGNAISFASTFDAAYDTVPLLSTLAGTYSGEVAFSQGVESASATVSTAGVLSGVGASGCTVTGSVAPRSRGNVFNLSLTFGAAPCFFNNQTMTGVAYFDAPTKRLYAFAPTATRSDAVLFLGVKQ